ncbi:MAG: hypothetical protein AB1629_07680 [Candidatus Omnitrophota bacterium]
MKNIILMVILFTFPLGCFANDTTTKPNSIEAKQPITLTIKSDKEIYGIGEDIVIDLEFKNDSDSPVILKFDKPGNLYAFFTFKIYRNNEELKTYRYFDLKDMVFPITETKLFPNSTYNMKIIINKLDWADEFKSMFETPGTYKIIITYGLIKDSATIGINSNSATIEVVDLCLKKVVCEGPCEFAWKGIQFNNSTRKCQESYFSGCKCFLPFKSLEECQNKCERKR